MKYSIQFKHQREDWSTVDTFVSPEKAIEFAKSNPEVQIISEVKSGKIIYEKITTKAAKCPECGKYHQICCIEYFKESKQVQRDFAMYMRDGFQIVDVTTHEAKSNFGYC